MTAQWRKESELLAVLPHKLIKPQRSGVRELQLNLDPEMTDQNFIGEWSDTKRIGKTFGKGSTKNNGLYDEGLTKRDRNAMRE